MTSPLTSIHTVSVQVKASWDTQQRPSYNPHRTYPKNPMNPNTEQTLKSNLPERSLLSVSALLTRKSPTPAQAVRMEEKYMGLDTWMPSAPKVEKPRSLYNAASLAYIGDCIYELYARRHFLFPPLNIEEYNDRVMAVVRAEAQDAMLQKLLNDKALSDEERDVLRWGKNISSSKTKTKKRAGVAVYNRASSLETLVGYLYLTNAKRLDEIMLKLGFSTGASTQMILEEASRIEFFCVENTWKTFNIDDVNGLIRLKKKLQLLKIAIKAWMKVAKMKSNDKKFNIQQNLLELDKLIDQGKSNDEILCKRSILINDVHEINAKDFEIAVQTVKNEFLCHFQKQFSPPQQSRIYFDYIFLTRLSSDLVEDLERDVSYDEVKAAVWDSNKYGLLISVIQRYTLKLRIRSKRCTGVSGVSKCMARAEVKAALLRVSILQRIKQGDPLSLFSHSDGFRNLHFRLIMRNRTAGTL
ncbi:ribonuclease III domain-containing protein [Tanacetum coccineum]